MDELKQRILNSSHLAKTDKDFLIASLPQLNKLELLKLEQNLIAGNKPILLNQLDLIKQKYYQSLPKQTGSDPISKFVEKFVPKKEKKPLSYSIFSKPALLGSATPKAINTNAPQPRSLQEFTDPAQLKYLHPIMIDDLGQDGFEQKFSQFFSKIGDQFGQIDDILTRRNYFLTYMQSPLFSAYVSSGLTALKHEELKPRKISLNLLYQIDQRYLNSRQFKNAALLTNHLKTLCIL